MKLEAGPLLKPKTWLFLYLQAVDWAYVEENTDTDGGVQIAKWDIIQMSEYLS